MVHADDWPTARGAMDEVWRCHTPTRVELRLRSGDGSHRCFQVDFLPVLTDGGQLQGCCALAVDVEERRQMSRRLGLRLQEQEVLTDLATNAGSMGVAVFGPNRDLRHANERLAEIAGTSLDELLRRSFEDLPPALPLQGLRTVVDRVQRERQPVRNLLCACPDDGPPDQKSYFRLHGAPVLGCGGPGVSCLVEDVTQAKRLEHDTNTNLSNLRESVQARDELLSWLAHDLRNPLMIFQMSMKRLGGQSTAQADAPDRLVGELNRQIEQLVELTNGLIDIAKLSSGRLELQLQEDDLAALVRTFLGDSRSLLQSSGCELRCCLPDELHGLWDRTRLRQVLSNLMSNACKYAAGAPIEVSLQAHDGLAQLQVRDQGMGIPAEDLPRLFQRFERLGAKDRSGTGLGLWITRRLVEAHGGTIEASSTPGKGSTFTVRLPIRKEPAEGSAVA